MLHFHLHGLDVAHVEQPVAVGAGGIGFQQFLVHQHGGSGGNPEVVVGRAQIGEVIVDTAATAAPPLLVVAHALHIAIVVVGPYEGDVVGQAQAGVVDIERLLVGHEYLRQPLGALLLVLGQDAALAVDDTLQRAGTVGGVGAALHGLVVEPTHAHGVDIVVLGRLADAVVQLADDGGAVGLVVPLAVTLLVPFRLCSIVEKQWLAVAGGNHDAALVGHLLTLRVGVEGTRTGVHGGSQHIGLQAQQQLAHTVVGLGADVAQVALVIG